MTSFEPARFPPATSRERADLDAILAATVLGHVGFVHQGQPIVIPTAVALWGNRILTHGSTGSHWMRMVASGIPVCVTIATIDGLVVARSAFESAVLYRSAVLFGSFSEVAPAEKVAALEVVTNRMLPGRTQEIRPHTSQELAATLLLSLPIDDWSIRVVDEWPDDPETDIAGPSWAGIIRFGTPTVQIRASRDLSPDTPTPRSVTAVSGVR